MSTTFSPYKYRLYSFDIKKLDVSNFSEYYNSFTFINKPDKRNTYKISLAQILNYLVDFGIGYNSTCTTTVTTYQNFNTAKYVNRHGTQSPIRPATVANIKAKLLEAVKAMIRHTVAYNGCNDGIRKFNTIYPKYIFTLDTDTKLVDKLKQLTGKTYKDISDDFTDFAYASDSLKYSLPANADGYIPADSLLLCPQHNHTTHPNMRKAMSYKWSVSLKPSGNTAWEGLINGCPLAQFISLHCDATITPATGPKNITCETLTASCEANWKYPKEVVCFENDKTYPLDAIDVNGKRVISIRYPGRRYRLLKREDQE